MNALSTVREKLNNIISDLGKVDAEKKLAAACFIAESICDEMEANPLFASHDIETEWLRKTVAETRHNLMCDYSGITRWFDVDSLRAKCAGISVLCERREFGFVRG